MRQAVDQVNGCIGGRLLRELVSEADNVFDSNFRKRRPNGWGEKGSETGNCPSSEQRSKNAQTPSRPVNAVLGACQFGWYNDLSFRVEYERMQNRFQGVRKSTPTVENDTMLLTAACNSERNST